MRQRATESVQFPDDQAIAGADVVERLLESGAIIPRSAGLIFKQMTRIDASGEQGVALQVRGLPVVVTGDPHVPHEHVRETPLVSFPSLPAIRHVFRTDFAWLCWGCQAHKRELKHMNHDSQDQHGLPVKWCCETITTIFRRVPCWSKAMIPTVL